MKLKLALIGVIVLALQFPLAVTDAPHAPQRQITYNIMVDNAAVTMIVNGMPLVDDPEKESASDSFAFSLSCWPSLPSHTI